MFALISKVHRYQMDKNKELFIFHENDIVFVVNEKKSYNLKIYDFDIWNFTRTTYVVFDFKLDFLYTLFMKVLGMRQDS